MGAASCPWSIQIRKLEVTVVMQQQGTVKWFNNSKGFGFILADEQAPQMSNEDVFVHYSVIEGDGFRTLKEGEKVAFEATRGPKGWHATSVRKPE